MKLAHLLLILLVVFSCQQPKPSHQQDQSSVEFNRKVELTGEHNFRDLGNYATTDGGQIKTGMLYRSGSLHQLTLEDVQKLEDLKIRTVVNFLTPDEIAYQGRDILPEGVTSVNLPIDGNQGEIVALIAARQTGDFSKIPTDFNYDIHKILPETGKEAYTELFQILKNPTNYPVLFHCSHGVHRTGTAAALILTALGVPWATVAEDYMLSRAYRLPENKKRIAYLDSLASTNDQVSDKALNKSYIEAFYLLQPKYIEGTREHVTEEYDGFIGYFDALGLTAEDINQLKQLLSTTD